MFFGRSRKNSSARRKPFSSRVDRHMNWKRGSRLNVESLEERRMLAVLVGPSDDLEGLNNAAVPDGQIIGGEPTVTIENFTVDDTVGDVRDVFRYTAHSSGKLLLNVLGDNDDYTFDLQSSGGASLIGGATSNTRVVVPVEEGSQYWLVVTDTLAGGAGTTYAAELVNSPAPTPASVSLSPTSDTGVSNTDGVTSDNTPTFFIQADLETFLNTSTGTIIGTIDSNGATGYDVELVATNLATGAVTSTPATRLGSSATWTATTGALADGDYLISARTQVFDPNGAPAGFSQLSVPTFVTIDAQPDAAGTIDLLETSDTGMDATDHVIKINQPAFGGSGPANQTVRVFAERFDPVTLAPIGTAQLVGIGVVGSENTFGTAVDGLGLWEVTVEPLADGLYNIFAQFEDAAGNLSEQVRLSGGSFTEVANVAIPDNGTVTSTLDLSAQDLAVIHTLDVRLNIQHANVGDLEITLVAPNGERITLVDNRGGTGNNFTNTVLSDAATNPISGITAAGAPFTGTFTPESTLEALCGIDPSGVWTLEIVDNNNNGVSGTLLDWGLVLTEGLIVDTEAPNTPLLDLITDTGRHDGDEITTSNLPTVVMVGNAFTNPTGANPFPNDVKYRLYLRQDGNTGLTEQLVYDSFTALGGFTTLGQITQQISLTLNDPNGTPLPDGVHNFKLEVEDRAGNLSEDFLLEFTVDTAAPPAAFGEPAVADDGLHPDSDSGVLADTATINDRITSDSTPTLFGYAEADSVVQLYLDMNADGDIDLGTDLLLGQTVAQPFDGNLAFTNGNFQITSTIDLNDPTLILPTLGRDGLRSLLLTAQDVAGNPVAVANTLVATDTLDIFLDTQGPQVNGVFASGDRTYDLFDPKPSENGFTPLIDSIDIDFIDNPVRVGPGGMPLAAASTFDLLETPDNATSEILAALVSPTSGINPIAGSERFVGRLGDGVDPNLAQSAIFANLNLVHGSGGTDITLPGTGVFLTSGIANIPDTNTDTSFDFGSVGVSAPNEGVASDVADLQAILSAAGQSTAVNNVNLFEFDFTVAAGQTSISADIVFGSDEFPDQGVTDIFAFIVDGVNYAFFPDGSLVNFVQGANAANFNDNASGDFQIEYDGISNRLNIVGLLDSTIAAGGTHTLKIAIGNTSDSNFDSGVFVANLTGGTGTTGGVGGGGGGVVGGFVYPAVNQALATVASRYQLVGDHVGPIAITPGMIQFIDNTVAGDIGRTTIRLNFDQPLPDDRYTLTILDTLTDDAGNQLDGESNADEPTDNPTFPSGDAVPGGDFVARFTVDSRPEIGSFVPQGINLDINGNFTWDPADQLGDDASNVDLTFTLPAYDAGGSLIDGGLSVHDLTFAGKFAPVAGPSVTSGRLFDQLAAYGNYNGIWRWLVDFDSDGVVNAGLGEIINVQTAVAGQASDFHVGAFPVAGNFDGSLANGDEIGLYNSGTWVFDSAKNYVLTGADAAITNGLMGHPVVGDFDGDGNDDLAVFNDNTWYFDLANDGLGDFFGNANADASLVWGFPGVLDRPVVADMDQDGIDDLGMWVPRNGPQAGRITAEWYFLVSGTSGQAPIAGTINTLNHGFSTLPPSLDIYAEFGDELALPIVGNFDPPVSSDPPETTSFSGLQGDYNNDFQVDSADVATWKANYGTNNSMADGNGDGRVDAMDYAIIRENFGTAAAPPAPVSTVVYTPVAFASQATPSFTFETTTSEAAPAPVAYAPVEVASAEEISTTMVEETSGVVSDQSLLLLATSFDPQVNEIELPETLLTEEEETSESTTFEEALDLVLATF